MDSFVRLINRARMALPYQTPEEVEELLFQELKEETELEEIAHVKAKLYVQAAQFMERK